MAGHGTIQGLAPLVGALILTTGCGYFGAGKDRDQDKGKDEPAGADEKAAAADQSKAEAPERFDDRLFLVGQTAELAGLDVTLAELRECRYERDTSQKSLEGSGRKLVGARVVFEATGEQAVNASRNFRAHDSDRVVYSTASLSGSDCLPSLGHKRLKTGEKSKGWIGFKVPKDVQGLTVRYEHRPPKQRGAKGTPAKQYPEFTLST